MKKINQKKIYKMNIYAPLPNLELTYQANISKKEIIKTFIEENQIYKITTVLVKQVKRNEFHEIITDIPIPIYKIDDETIIDEYGYTSDYHSEKSTESPMFGIVKEEREYDISSLLGIRKRKKTYNKISLKEASHKEYSEYLLNNNKKIFLIGMREIYKQAEKNLHTTKFIKKDKRKAKQKRYH